MACNHGHRIRGWFAVPCKPPTTETKDMNYLDQCAYQENFQNGEQFYTFSGPCIITNEIIHVTVKGPDLYQFRQGKAVQDAFPYLSKDEREFIISGISAKGWNELFGNPE